MNPAVMEIRIKVMGRDAQRQLRGVQRDIAALGAMTGKAPVLAPWDKFTTGLRQGVSKVNSVIDAGLKKLNSYSSSLINFGKQTQWVGRQLTYTFTLPLLLAGGMATKWALDNEAAMTRVRKVYGDGSESAAQLRGETDALARSFELLSSRYGVNQAEVIGIGEAWAQAGAAGVAVANSTKTSLDFMILSGLGWQETVEGLIAVQTAYQLSSGQLADQISILNAIENQTAINMGGLITVVQRAGGAARAAGIDVRHLSAMAAALVPATGSAASAGDSLKTVISRLFAPTRDAERALEALGVDLASVAWQSANGVEKIELLAASFNDLTAPQEALVASVLGSRRQYNRLLVLLQDIRSENGLYQRALQATATQEEANAQKAKELSVFLSSQPQAFKIMTTSIQNLLAKAILPLLPAMAGLLMRVTQVIQAFTDLSPETQQFILMALVALAALGPMLSLLGNLATLFGVLGKMVFYAATGLKTFIGMSMIMSSYVMKAFAVMTAFILQKLGLTTAAHIASDTVKSTSSVKAAGVSMLAWRKSKTGEAAAAAASAASHAASEAAKVGATTAATAAVTTTSTAGATTVATAWAAAWTAMTGPVGLAALAIIGIIATLVASLLFIFNEGFRNKVIEIFDSLPMIVKVAVAGMLGPFGWLLLAIATMRDRIAELPAIIAQVFTNIVRIIGKAISKVIDWLSYLNPFARHSPSLVDNVTKGISEILYQYGRLSGVGNALSSATAAHQAFLNVTGQADPIQAEQNKQASNRADIAENRPEALGTFDSLVVQLGRLKGLLPAIKAEVATQERVVDSWERSLKSVSNELDAQNDILDDYKDHLEEIDDQISASKATLDDYASTGIVGMRAMDDAAFSNEMAQKRLRLEMLKLEEAGGSIEDVRSQLAALQGDIEEITAERDDLRLAGAGSDILSVYDAQIAALKEQRDGIEDLGAPYQQLEDDLKKLERAADRLDLERSITFDPQIRQIDQLVDGLNELPFDEIVANIRKQQAEIARLEVLQTDANRQVEAQQYLIDEIIARRDSIERSLDIEKEKLEAIREVYDSINTVIGDIESSINDLTSAIRDAVEATKELEGRGFQEQFDEAALGDFEVPGGDGALGREGDVFDIEAFNKEMEDELNKALEGMGDFDLFKPIRDAWNTFVGWMGDAWNTFAGWFASGWDTLWGWLETIMGPAVEQIKTIWNTLADAWTWLWDNIIWPVIEAAWGFIQPILEAIGGFITGYLVPIFQLFATIGAIVWEVITRVISFAWDNIFPIFQNIANFVGVVLANIFTWFRDSIISPVWGTIQAIISAAWDKMSPVFDKMHTAIGLLGKAFEWFRDSIIDPVFGTIQTIVSSAWDGILGHLQNGANAFIGAFNWVARGVNSVASFLGIEQRVSEMDELNLVGGSQLGGRPQDHGRAYARGGQLEASTIGGGFRTNGPRAIVGEGNPLFPEYVIPTDPAHRTRANALWAGAGRELGVPGFDIGGILSSAGEALFNTPSSFIGSVLEGIKNVGAGGLWMGVRPVAENLINAIPLEFMRSGGHKVLDWIDDWVRNVPPPAVSEGAGWEAQWSAIKNQFPGAELFSSFRPGSITVSGNLSNHAKGRAIDISPNMDIFNWIKANYPNSLELIYSPAGTGIARGNPHYWTGAVRDTHWDHIHWAMANGGVMSPHVLKMAHGGMIVNRTPGGVPMIVGEGNQNEEIQVRPLNRRGPDDDGKVVNIYGDLVFPNITDGNDAEELIRNLEAIS